MRQLFTHCYILLALLAASWAANGQTLTATPTSLGGFTTAVSTPSAQQSVLVSGSGLTNNVTATAPAGFEVSWTSGFNFTTSQVLTQSTGSITNIPLYVRMTGAVLGPVSGVVTIASPGTTTQNVAVSGTATAAPTPNPASTLTSISPTSGPGGTQVLVTFYGSGFVPGATIGLQAGASFVTATYISSTQLTALITLPSVAAPLVTYFIASNPPPGGGGSSVGGMKFFTINPSPPVITGFSPASGPPGTLVTITGRNLDVPGGTGTVISFNGTLVTVVPQTPSVGAYYVRVPTGATTGYITLTNGNGGAVSPTQFVVPPARPPFFEDFETGTKTSYAAASVQLQTGGWTLGESLIGTTAGADKFNGLKSARLRGGGFMEMDVDKPNGAGVVTVSAAAYATETGASFVPEISTDGGVTYTSLLGGSPAPTLTSTLTPYSFTANRTGNVRLRFSSTNTAGATNPRINLDDIGITDYRVGTATKPGQSLSDLSLFPNPAQGRVTVQGTGAGPVWCSLRDLAGRQLTAPVALPADGNLALPANLPTGLYLLQVETPTGRRTLRLATL
ncbi:IPT/TIG domain-containing protein [Hymenobacter properus]|uniref:IPT/TIG domain-containing protein n=1 Tax=Hymenobacter properus TaxID=2791026 RepID=A0A931BNT9_9BACT|nr:IPT/TIG domain-containing protein [Hymenobacter properus]MBF9143688.1 IPT/TIG domain-containing protein [Hymenobacter properus]MBR7722501.1 IPT/TIG domain-containing protein [Microvirga sp. SRT04]